MTFRYTVEPWAPEYGIPASLEQEEPESKVDPAVEVPPDRWAPRRPMIAPASDVLFVDGVRRVDANVWIHPSTLGICASYAAGAVRCVDGVAAVVGAVVERGLFTSAPEAAAIVTRQGTYAVRSTVGDTPERLWLGLQQRMGELEGRVAAEHADASLVVVDGPLSHHLHVPDAIGYVKTQRVHYLPPALRTVVEDLGPGMRTPLFLVTTSWSRFSWYCRLAVGDGWGGVVRCEAAADVTPAEAAATADLVAATLPRFASEPHKDPRAPQNLYPIGGLERELRRRLGDRDLMYRALKAAAG